MFNFGRRIDAMVGIDISTMSIKMLQLSRSGDRYRVEHYAAVPMPSGAVVDKDIKDVEAVAKAISQAKEKAGVEVESAAVAIASSAIITKTMQVEPGLSDYEIENFILLDADKFIPYPLEEVRLDFDVLGVSAVDPDLLDVLVVASRAENIEVIREALDISGLEAKVIDVESYAVERACGLLTDQLVNGGMGKNIGVLDMGASSTTLTVLKDLVTTYSHEEAVGGKHLTRDLQQQYGLSYSQAGYVKKRGGMSADGKSNEVLEIFKNTLLPHVLRTLQFYSSACNEDVEQLVLAGGNASIDGVAELIAEHTGVPVIVADPFVNMVVSGKVKSKALRAEAPALMVACGLAMRGFD